MTGGRPGALQMSRTTGEGDRTPEGDYVFISYARADQAVAGGRRRCAGGFRRRFRGSGFRRRGRGGGRILRLDGGDRQQQGETEQ